VILSLLTEVCAGESCSCESEACLIRLYIDNDSIAKHDNKQHRGKGRRKRRIIKTNNDYTFLKYVRFIVCVFF